MVFPLDLHAELDGALLAPAFERLIDGWIAQGHTLVPVATIARTLAAARLPVKAFAWGEVPGRSGELMIEPNNERACD